MGRRDRMPKEDKAANVAECNKQLRKREGPYYDKWLEGMTLRIDQLREERKHANGKRST